FECVRPINGDLLTQINKKQYSLCAKYYLIAFQKRKYFFASFKRCVLSISGDKNNGNISYERSNNNTQQGA
ncbi:TPA: hypothetical protein ACIAQY_004642, partial [Salmonella enterica subsp. diarizonae serovar 61:l,v:z35]